MQGEDVDGVTVDHCRIGSLEIKRHREPAGHLDHCRIGSLETKPAYATRIESLITAA